MLPLAIRFPVAAGAAARGDSEQYADIRRNPAPFSPQCWIRPVCCNRLMLAYRYAGSATRQLLPAPGLFNQPAALQKCCWQGPAVQRRFARKHHPASEPQSSPDFSQPSLDDRLQAECFSITISIEPSQLNESRNVNFTPCIITQQLE